MWSYGLTCISPAWASDTAAPAPHLRDIPSRHLPAGGNCATTWYHTWGEDTCAVSLFAPFHHSASANTLCLIFNSRFFFTVFLMVFYQQIAWNFMGFFQLFLQHQILAVSLNLWETHCSSPPPPKSKVVAASSPSRLEAPGSSLSSCPTLRYQHSFLRQSPFQPPAGLPITLESSL